MCLAQPGRTHYNLESTTYSATQAGEGCLLIAAFRCTLGECNRRQCDFELRHPDLNLLPLDAAACTS